MLSEISVAHQEPVPVLRTARFSWICPRARERAGRDHLDAPPAQPARSDVAAPSPGARPAKDPFKGRGAVQARNWQAMRSSGPRFITFFYPLSSSGAHMSKSHRLVAGILLPWYSARRSPRARRRRQRRCRRDRQRRRRSAKPTSTPSSRAARWRARCCSRWCKSS